MTHLSNEKISYPFRMHPLQRILIGLLLTVVAFIAIPSRAFSPLMMSMVLWVVFSLTFNVTSWIVLFKQPIEDIRKVAQSDDGSKLLVVVMVLLCSFSSMCAVLLLMISREGQQDDAGWTFPVSVLGILLAWAMVHTIFAFHYAHMYYGDTKENSDVPLYGLDFPKENKPDYIDFAYFSFVIGCTFQVSDVQVTARRIRRMVLLHGLISFIFNTFVVAFIINLVAGLNK